MENTSYYLKSARHQFAKIACKGGGGVAVVLGTALSAAIGIGTAFTLLDETPDHRTTPQTETVLAEIRTDMAALQQNFTELKTLDTRLKTGDYRVTEYASLQNRRNSAHYDLAQQAEPVLDRILFTPHLSEAQAENLMEIFKNSIEDPAEIDSRYDIADYGFLRDKRDEAIKNLNSNDVETILTATQHKIAERDKNNGVGVGVLGIPIFLISMLAGAAMGDSRRIKNWAREKPAKHIKAKH